jgi:ATP-dependent RNA helicase SUPV3L1/SUV3
MLRRSLPPQLRARGVTAVLGPTNTGKTHLAIERMLGHESGMIGLPLRLLAREVYQRMVEKAGAHNVALVTGEEKIKPDRPRYWVSTVEAMPRDLDLAFVAVDEIQLAADLDRGHVFTDRLLNQRGREETLLIGSLTMRPIIESLIPGVHVITRPRLSKLSFSGEKKVSRLPHRSAIVAFSTEEVYAIAELIRRQRGGAAVVLGALSPRTRNAQVELYQSGHVDYLVATDAIGMGLNLDVDHVAFASDKKFDGFRFRKLDPAELGQIAGRAGRYMRDGTFGTAGRCPPFDAPTVEALENHAFDALRVLQWRNPDLDFSSIGRLRDSLFDQPREHGLVRGPMSEDLASLEVLAREADIQGMARTKAAVQRLWQVCQVPDYRKVSPQTHADLVGQIYRFLMRDGAVPADWFSRHIVALDRTDGDIDTLSNRIAQVRTWSFVANRPDWLKDPEHWQGAARQVEDKLSDALHERLAQRFVDRRTSVLMRRLRENAMLEAEITASGDVTVEGQHVGHLHGFHFVPDPGADTGEAKTLRNAASKALAGEIEVRADRFSAAADSSLVLSNDGTIRWQGDPVAKVEAGDKIYDPRIRILADEQLTGPAREKVEGRLRAWLKAHVVRLLGPAIQLEDSAELQGLARGIAFQIAESLGVLERAKVLNDVRSLDQDGRGALRRAGVRFGAYHLYLPALLKPAPRTLAAQLWALRNGGLDQPGLDEIAHLAASGRTSIPVNPTIAHGLYRAAGYRVCGGRAVRVDILERLADLIRPAIGYRPGITPGEPPAGAADGDGFVATVAMTSLVGCAGEDFGSILKSLGYVSERRVGPAITVPLVAAPTVATASGPSADVAVADPAPAGSGADAPEDGVHDPASAASGAGAPGDGVHDPASAASGADAPGDGVHDPRAAPDASVGDGPPAGEVPAQPGSAAAADASVDVPPSESAPTADPGASADVAARDPEPSPDDPPVEPAGATAEGPVGSAEGSPPSDAALVATGTDAAAASADGAVEPASPEEPAAAPAEPQTVEVWRQGRRHHEGGHARHGRGRGERRDGRPRQGERPPGDRPPGERPQGERPHGGRAAGTLGDRGPRQERPHREGRPDRSDHRAAAGDGRPQNRPARDKTGRPEDRKGPRPERRFDDRRDAAQNRREDRRDKPPDPDSPFAKLMALKAQLENAKGNKP